MLRDKLLFSGGLVILTIQLLTITPDLVTVSDFNFGDIIEVSDRSGSFLRSGQLALGLNQYDSITFTGDIMLARHVEVLMSRHGQDYPFKSMKLTTLSENSAVIGNFESAMSLQHKRTPAGNLRFSTNQIYLPALSAAGFTHLSLANNHSLDYAVSIHLSIITHTHMGYIN